LKYEKSNLIYIQTKNNFVILTHKTNTLITPTLFLKNVKRKKKWMPTLGKEGVNKNYWD